ncbi:glycosyltransferase [Candidatus Kaiserbacteria bacterium]|nr:glycosyltransferase [Candidatus Kaiserbacteria bacterium]
MKILICTQVFDPQHTNLGFFVRWVEEFKKHCEVEVITLERLGPGRLRRAWHLLRLAATLEYDAVFVHMNPEYLVAAGWLWKLRGKKTALWYTHKSVDLKLRIAEKFADVIFTASKESFRLPSRKVHVMGHGIDTDFFTPDPTVVRGDWWLSAGRLNTSKRHDLAIRAAAEAHKALRIVGDGPERNNLEALAQELGASVTFLGGLDHMGVRDEFRRASLFLHMSETGSLDKMVLEALACGCPLSTRDPALQFLETKDASYVREHHSLQALIPRILKALA